MNKFKKSIFLLMLILLSFPMRAVLAQSLPSPPILVSPSSGTSAYCGVQLSWNTSLGATGYTFQVSSLPDFSSSALLDYGHQTDTTVFLAWGSAPVGITNGTIAYWRVSSTDSSGSSAWSATWSFTMLLTPNPPTLSWPLNAVTGIPTNPTLAWNTGVGWDGGYPFRLQIATDASFSDVVVDDSTVSNNSDAISGLGNNKVYYWRVKESNRNGWSDWSSVWSFTTTAPPPPVPAAPTLGSPPNNATGIPMNPVLTWNRSPGAYSYELLLSTTAAYSDTVYRVYGTADTFGVVAGTSLSYDTRYYWHVEAENSLAQGTFSDTWTFTTAAASPPTPPTLATPPDGATGVSANPTLVWNTSNGATSYGLQVSTNSTFSPLVLDQSGITTNSYGVSSLANGTTFFWRVNASNSNGTSNWSSVWSFKTTGAAPPPIPAAPELASPPDSGFGISTGPIMTWKPSAAAYVYELLLSTSPAFSDTVYRVYGTTDTFGVVVGTNLSYDTRYFWHVKATNSAGQGSVSDTWTFTTVFPPVTFSLDKSSIGFGIVAIDTVATQNLEITNTSSSLVLQVDSIYAPGKSFSVTPKSATILPGRISTLQVSFTPDTIGIFADTLFINTISQTPVVRIPLSGNSPYPQVSLASSTMEFDTANVGGSASLSVKVSNRSVNALIVDSIRTSTGFFRVAPCSLPDTIRQYDTLSVAIAFMPDSAGAYSDTLHIYSNAQHSATKVVLTGICRIPTGITRYGSTIPSTFELCQNYPNPFNPTTTIRFGLPKQSQVTVSIYDMLGRKVADLVSGRLQAGYYQFTWDGREYASGVYFCALHAGTHHDTKKLLLLK